jgi:hypothetical protein
MWSFLKGRVAHGLLKEAAWRLKLKTRLWISYDPSSRGDGRAFHFCLGQPSKAGFLACHGSLEPPPRLSGHLNLRPDILLLPLRVGASQPLDTVAGKGSTSPRNASEIIRRFLTERFNRVFLYLPPVGLPPLAKILVANRHPYKASYLFVAQLSNISAGAQVRNLEGLRFL